MWLYLQIIGKPTEKFQHETNFWTFNRTQLRNAITCLVFNDEVEMDETAVKMKELISKHLKTDKKLFDWSRAIFDQVPYPINDLINSFYSFEKPLNIPYLFILSENFSIRFLLN